MIVNRPNSHEMFGYDFMVDTSLNVWLIEVNSSPAMDYSTKVTEKLCKDVLSTIPHLVLDCNYGEKFDDPENKMIGKL